MNVTERVQRLFHGKTLREFVRDRDWLKNSYISGRTTYDRDDIRYSKITTARFKYSDTTLGGNIAINPLPQFTETADIPVKGLVEFTDSSGMGRFYSENVDDNKRLITVRAGVAQFTGAGEFFTGFYNADMSYLARTGRSRGIVTDIIYKMAVGVGFILPLINLPLFVLNMVGNGINYLTMTPRHKYYYLKPAMPAYWMTVTTIVNIIAANKGMVPRFFSSEMGQKLNGTYNFSSQDNELIRKLLGNDMIFEKGGINVHAMSTRAQRIARRAYAAMEDKLNAYLQDEVVGVDTYAKAYAALEKIYDGEDRLNISTNSNISEMNNGTPVSGFAAYLTKWFNSDYGKSLVSESTDPDGVSSAAAETGPVTDPSKSGYNQDSISGIWNYMKAEWDDGASFVTFRVDAEGSAQESFTNQVGESSLAVTINGKAGEARSTRFSLSDGQIGGKNNPLQLLSDAVTGGVSAVVSGLATGMGLSGLGVLAGNAFVDIPKHWQSSIAQLPRMNYTLTLTSPYNNMFSQMFNIYVPLSMILALALPQSTGAYSYTSPRLCELYDRGRAQSRLCMVDSLSITRGVHNLPFDRSGNAMGIDIAISFIDMSSIMHAPITEDWGFTNGFDSLFDMDSAFSDYMAVLSALSLHENVNMSERASIQWRRFRLGLENSIFPGFGNSAAFAKAVANFPGIRLAQVFFEGIQNR